ncbi:transcriptional regulator, TetR family [Beutenbergia cavernae DSM 12333]|uniref:Transcriptional regulator, TetR family n=1 Tax=Beutenbergia cavernae (strain ATCC BAA-8 / DSM 12333 / CCUG 43141 / JCM 11478 / NBRC 16432 / NCIMB 13614 / HKI 0122) TaxID=471853 RepID=C5C0U8_BEUC1|nr:TetR/AcrR family transcriptional regulator [Beutenbergia cavernae]ACQ79352.1 transcriptional regulator, TetR family [Beutenbergia cavernae DSM 12333]
MPPTNPRRRRALTDAAIELLASDGAHGLTHRAVERVAGVPAGTVSNYFPSREALLVAAAERIVELHLAEMDAATRADDAPPDGPAPGEAAGMSLEQLVDVLADSLLHAATTLRARYLAVFELQLEARRRPTLAAALAGFEGTSLTHTTALHGELGLPPTPGAVQTLITLYGGALFTLVASPAQAVDPASVRRLAAAMVRGAFGAP